MVFTLAPASRYIYAKHSAEHETKPLDNGYDYGPRYGACVSSFSFLELRAAVRARAQLSKRGRRRHGAEREITTGRRNCKLVPRNLS